MKTVTPRQLAVLTYLRDYRARLGYSPTMQEIGDHLGLSKVTVFEHVKALERKGLLVREGKHKARSLRVSSQAEFPDERPGRLPLAGRIAAGCPIEAIEDAQTLDLNELFRVSGQTFVLEVTGDSMIDEQIRPGDYVICQRRNTARDGEIVVALLPDGEATLKTLRRQKGKVLLEPANPKYKPIHVKQLDVQGVVIGVVRRL
jgi:repressor LexA